MKYFGLSLLWLLVLSGCAHERLTYETKNIYGVAAQVLGIPEIFKVPESAENQKILEHRFPVGMDARDAWTEVMKIRRAHLYATEIVPDICASLEDFSLFIFRYQRDERLPLKDSIHIFFVFDANHKLIRTGYLRVIEDW